MREIVFNLVGCVLIEVLCGVLLPEGKMQDFVMSIISFFMFYCIVYPLCNNIVMFL